MKILLFFVSALYVLSVIAAPIEKEKEGEKPKLSREKISLLFNILRLPKPISNGFVSPYVQLLAALKADPISNSTSDLFNGKMLNDSVDLTGEKEKEAEKPKSYREKRNVAYAVVQPSKAIAIKYFTPTAAFVSMKVASMWDTICDLFNQKILNKSVDLTKKDDNNPAEVQKKLILYHTMPSFELPRIMRKRRDLRKKRALAAIVPVAGKIVGWTIGMTVAGAAASATGAYVSDALAQKREQEYLERLPIDCKKNNVGCFEGVCWSNCGPRMRSSDWCFTTEAFPANLNDTQIAKCKIARDCNPCWECATSCYMDDINNDVVKRQTKRELSAVEEKNRDKIQAKIRTNRMRAHLNGNITLLTNFTGF